MMHSHSHTTNSGGTFPSSVTTISSVAIALLMAATSLAGLAADGLYRDNVLVTAALRGNDLVTLAIASPLLVAAVIAGQRSQRAQLVWLGLIAYTIYNYAFYLFGASFNDLFLAYCALVVTASAVLILGLQRVDHRRIARRIAPHVPTRTVAAFLALFGLMLATLWVSRSVRFLFTGDIPTDIVNTGHRAAVVYAIDLTLLIPAMLVAAALLWSGRRWGYAIGVVVSIKAATYSLALIAMSAFADRAGVPSAWALAPLWCVLGAGAVGGAFLLLAGMQEVESIPHVTFDRGHT
jgi:hypothetical protein